MKLIWSAAIFYMSLTSVQKSEASSELDGARIALGQGLTKEAGKIYDQITPLHSEWPNKLRDLIVWHLLKGEPKEAWQISMLASKTRTTLKDLTYLRDLSALLSGACSFSREKYSDGRHLLLDANIFRKGTKFSRKEEPQASTETQTLSYRSLEGSPRLQDIPEAKIYSGRGCPFKGYYLGDKKIDGEKEKELLEEWVAEFNLALPRVSGSLLVLSRLLYLYDLQALNGSKQDETKRADLLYSFSLLTDEDWQEFSDPERIYVWNALQNASKDEEKSTDILEKKTTTVKKIILSSKDKYLNLWLAKINFLNLAPAEAVQILKYAASIDAVSHQDYINYLLALFAYREGDWQASLFYIRRLLVLEETSVSQEIQFKSLELALRILEEFRYDTRVLAALQTSLPFSKWQPVILHLLRYHSLLGKRSGFDRLRRDVEKTLSRRLSRHSQERIDLYEVIARRDTAGLRKVIKTWEGKRRLASSTLLMIEELAQSSLSLTAEQGSNLEGMFTALAGFLRRYYDLGQSRQRLEDVLHILESDQATWRRSSSGVRKGAVQIGEAVLGDFSDLPSPFIWAPPSDLDERELLFIPLNFSSNEFEIK